MKVLFVCDIDRVANPFVSTLCKGLEEEGVCVVSSVDEFWHNAENYDLIHFQWPEAIYSWKKNVTDKQVERLRNRINNAKRKGVKIAMTCHNLKPHIITDANVFSLYEIIYESCDVIFHLADYSRQFLEKKIPYAKHYILPHHLFNRIYTYDCDALKAKMEIGLSSEQTNVLCFGEFRTDEERQLILDLRKRTKGKAIQFVVPGFYRKRILSKNPFKSIKRFLHIVHYKQLGLKFHKGFISDRMTELYFSAADIVMIQRFSILNSGNLPMGFAAGKVVIGANIGNVGNILHETGNPTFDPHNINSVIEAIEKAKSLSNSGKGKWNKEYANMHWSTEVIAKQLLGYYEEILKN